jgi:hypothetical protein
MSAIAFLLDALNFLSLDPRSLFGPFVNVYFVADRRWSRRVVGRMTSASSLFGVALQTRSGAAIVSQSAPIVGGESLLR